MSKPDGSKKLKLIINSIEFKQNNLRIKLFDLQKIIVKKEVSIRSFEAYLQEYKKKLYARSSIAAVDFVNQQKFINKIAAVLASEREALANLRQKKDGLYKEYAENSQRLDVIETTLARNLKESEFRTEKIIEQMGDELFNNHLFVRGD